MKIKLTLIACLLPLTIMAQKKVNGGTVLNTDSTGNILKDSYGQLVEKISLHQNWVTVGNSYGKLQRTKIVTILNKGKPKHRHDWVLKVPLLNPIKCTALHDEAGCPDSWPDDYRICTLCLRHENIKITYKWITNNDQYDTSLKKIVH